MKHTRKDLLDIFVIGFALFSMFFGAGNVIFPPYLGLGCGKQWFLGFVCYYLADIGLALLALFAILRQGGPEGVTRRLGKVPTAILMSASRPISRAGVRILPTMSTTADSRTQRNKMSRKNRAENSAGLKPETSGARDIS